jgi:hypothetical protein
MTGRAKWMRARGTLPEVKSIREDMKRLLSAEKAGIKNAG